MKKIGFLLAIFFFSVNFPTVFAYDFSAVCNGQKLYFSITSDTIPYTVEVVFQYDDGTYYDTFPKGKLIIPSLVDNNGITYSVKSIGYAALYNCVDLTSIVLPDSLEYISDYAFGNCENLDTIYIPQNVKYIGYVSFKGCGKLLSIDVDNNNLFYKSYEGIVYDYSMDTLVACPGGKTGHIAIYNQTKIIRLGAFKDCKKMTSIDFRNSVSIIEDYAFDNCIGLSGTLILPNTLKYIGAWAFSSCTSLYGTLRIPDSVILIYDGAFCLCTGIKELIIGNSVEKISRLAFMHCIELNHIIIGNSVKKIQEDAFNSCWELKSINFGNSVEFIGDYAFFKCINLQGTLVLSPTIKGIGFMAFSECENITSVIIGDSIKYIGMAAFSGCFKLHHVTIGNSIETIDKSAFTHCYIKEVTIRAAFPPEINSSTFYFDKIEVLYVPCGSKTYFQNDTNWNKISNIQEGKMDYIINMGVNIDDGGIVTASVPDCITYQSVLKAIPNSGYVFDPHSGQGFIYDYVFDKWSDGNTDNPRTVIVTSDTSFMAVFKYAVDIEEQDINNNFIIFPNPANNQITLDNGQTMIKDISIYDIMGREIRKYPINATKSTLDVSSLQSGMYFLKIITEQGILTRKVQVIK